MLFKIILLILLILINGLFSATEMAFLSINKYELNKEIKKNNRKAIKIAQLLEDSSTFLSAIQIAITLSGLLASAFAAENFASELASIVNISFITEQTLITLLVILITILLSYFTLIFGELVPKKIGLTYSKKIAFMMVKTINIVIKIYKPFIFILKTSTDYIIKLLKIKKTVINYEDDLKDSISESNLEDLEKKLLLNVFEFNDTTIEKIMTPKKNVITISISATKDELLKIVKEHKFTRFPISDGPNIIGILNVKDLVVKHNNNFNIIDYIRSVTTLQYDMIIDDAFLYLNSNYEVIAIVSKNNSFIGIITLEDIIEELIGNVFDEYDKNI